MKALKWAKHFIGKIWLVFIGIVIGGALTNNKYIWLTLIIYTVIMLVFNLIADRILKIKNAADKKMEAINQGKQAVNDYIDYVTKALNWTYSGFDRWFPAYTFLISFSVFCLSIYLLIKQQWLLGLTAFIGSNIFIVQNNIWRVIKNGVKPV